MDATSIQMVPAAPVPAVRVDQTPTQVAISPVHQVRRTALQDVLPAVVVAELHRWSRRMMSSNSSLPVVVAVEERPTMQLARLVRQPALEC
jgi:hypothetical protein